jgi:hypothetical protein
VLAMNRWRQMQSPSVAFPHQVAPLPCRTDKVRPGDCMENDAPMSTSVKVRRDYGRMQKQNFYEQETGLRCPPFVHDLNALTADESFGNLHHKMAVVHLDGNGFGKIQDELCDSAENQRQFDQNLRSLRREMLRELLQRTSSAEKIKQWRTNSGEHRIETLLWGGDEIIWVVPAWTGLWILCFFFETSQSWKFQGRPLTHSAGVVFCHHNAPIHRITDLAQRLTYYAKSAADRSQNVIAWQILESFDHIGQNLEGIIESRLPEGCGPTHFLLPGRELGSIMDISKRLKRELPRNKVHSIARTLANRDSTKADTLASQTLEQLPKAADDFRSLAQRVGNERMAWVHLAELWDYFPE